MEAFATAPPPFNPHLPVNPPPAQYPGMPPQPQFMIHEQQTLGIAAETTMQMYPGASPTPAIGFQQPHMHGYPPTPPQPQYQPAPTTGYPPQQPTGHPPQQPTGYSPQQPTGYSPQQPTGYPPQQPTGYSPQQPTGYPPQQPTGYSPQQPTGYPPQRPTGYSPQQPTGYPSQQPTGYPSQQPTGYSPQQPTGYTMQGVDAVAIGTYSKHMGLYGAAPPTPPARPHPSMLPQHSVDYPPSIQPQQPRHSLQHQSTFPTFEVNQTTYPTHARPVAQNYTSVTHVQQFTTLQQQQQPATPSSDPVAPQGYNIVDVFQEGNIIQLIPRGDSAPIKLSGSHIKHHGDYLHPENTFFRVKIPYPGIVQLSNYNKPKSLVTIDKKGHIRGDGKETGDQSCQFKATLSESESKHYVCLESMKYQGWFLSMKENGRKFGPSDAEAQFRVRVEQWVTPRKSVLKAFGRQSIANKLRDGGTIQLKGKNSNMYLRINKRGVVDEVIHGDDRLTYFTLSDRGLGVVSLNSYQHGGHRIRVSNCVLEGKGDPDPSADFYLKETRDGTLSLESVTCPGTYVGVGKGADKSTTFAVYHVDIDKHGKRESVNTSLVTP